MRKVREYHYRYRGIWLDGAVCGVAVYAPEVGDRDRRLLIRCTELGENAGASITNMAEALAAEVVARHFPGLLDADPEPMQPVRWVEPYPPALGVPGEHDEVTFIPWRIRVTWLGGVRRMALGSPIWRRLSPEESGTLFGPSPQGRDEAAA